MQATPLHEIPHAKLMRHGPVVRSWWLQERAAKYNSKKEEMIMTRTLASLAIALTFVAGASVAHADTFPVHGYLGTVYGGK